MLQIRFQMERCSSDFGCGGRSTTISMKRSVLFPPALYTETLEEVLRLRLDDDSIKSKAVRSKLTAVAKAVAALSKGLTKGRSAFLEHSYLSNADLHAAYQLYFTTTNFLKIVPPLRELSYSGFFERRDSLSVLDLGSGTGAGLWGLLSFLAEEQYQLSCDLHAVDSVPENLKSITAFHTAISRRTDAKTLLKTSLLDLEALSKSSFDKRYDLIIIMNTLNELSDESKLNLLDLLPQWLTDDGVFIIIDPATRAESRGVLSFRDKAVEQGWTVYAPCTRQQQCPALSDEDNWCHSEYKWQRPGFIKTIDDETGNLRLSLKSTYVTLNRAGMTLSDALRITQLSRVVSERFDEKGRTRAILCDSDGREEYILNKRDKTAENKTFFDIQRYDIVSIEDKSPREHDIQITGSSVVLPVLQSSGAR